MQRAGKEQAFLLIADLTVLISGGCKSSAERTLFTHKEQGSFFTACWQGTGFSTQAAAALKRK